MAERSAAQKAATRRMIAANRRGRGGGGRARAAGAAIRRHAVKHYQSATDAGGLAVAAYGLIKPAQPGWSSPLDPRTSDPNRAYNLAQSIPIYGKDPNMAGNRATVGAGLLVVVGGRVLRHVIKPIKIKIGTHRIRLWGAGS